MRRSINGPLEKIPFRDLADRLGARYNSEEDAILVMVLGQEYVIRRSGMTLRGQKAPETHEAVIRDYLSSAGSSFVAAPWRSLGDILPGASAEFRKRVETPLTQHVKEVVTRVSTVLPLIDGDMAPSMIGSDLAFRVRAFPKVHLHVELSLETQEFPAETWILFSNNADVFLSPQGLQLLGELFKERLISLLRIY